MPWARACADIALIEIAPALSPVSSPFFVLRLKTVLYWRVTPLISPHL